MVMCSAAMNKVIFDYVYSMTYATYKFVFMALPRIVDREHNVFGLVVHLSVRCSLSTCFI